MLIKKAVIIAAGNGSRLKSDGVDLPKPLRAVAGLSLLKRIILSAKKAGITEFVIVVGYQKEKIIEALSKENLGVRIDFAINPEWKKSNGLSVLAAKPFIRENFVLLMSDHIFRPETLEKLRQVTFTNRKAWLGVDFKTQEIFDADDATKVWASRGEIHAIGKELKKFNGIDTGLFAATPDLFDALEESQKEGDCSLSDGIRFLAQKGEMGAVDIGNAFWADVDTPEALAHAETALLQACRKSTDGFIARNFNRRISLWITRRLLKTGISANHMTGFTSLIGILSGVFMARGDYFGAALGAFLFKWASILDGCDGELSKLKLTNSKRGEWLDTLSDNLTYVCFTIGVIVALAKRGDPHIMVTGTITMLGLVMSLSVMFYYLARHTNSGSLLAIQEEFKQTSHESRVKKFVSKIQFMGKRDFFALAFMVLGFLDQLQAILWLTLITTNIVWVVLLKHVIPAKAGLLDSRLVPRE
ncbi:MAG: NTP transferase domain-containing protein [Deltaproteobacteria bacterium]|nr:NTP transferase domain-containing protein [Deltaproteobacteria bacterium]